MLGAAVLATVEYGLGARSSVKTAELAAPFNPVLGSIDRNLFDLNCPAPPQLPVLSSTICDGTPTRDAKQGERLSNIGLHLKIGGPDDQMLAHGKLIMTLDEEGHPRAAGPIATNSRP